MDRSRLYAKVAIALYCGLMLVAAGKTATKPIQWVPDRVFAKVVKVGFEKANPTVTILEDVCVKPGLPKNTAITAGLPQDDCLVVATRPKGSLCFELLYEAGNTTGKQYACALVRKTMRRDVKPGWVVRYPTPFTA